MSLRPLNAVLSDYRHDPDMGRSSFEVGPGATGFDGRDRFPGRTLEEYTRDAARLLVAGYEVRWMPGDATVYRLALVQPTAGDPHLVFTNPSFTGAIKIPDGRLLGVEEYVRSSAPRGGWMGLRPLLAVLTGRDRLGPSVFRLRAADAHDEAKARVEYAGHQPFERTDADLGRKVRLLVNSTDEPVAAPDPIDITDEVMLDLLSLVSLPRLVMATEVAQWSQSTRAEVADWVSATHLVASDNEGIVIPPTPKVLLP